MSGLLRPSHRRGFTLVELLVVIGIIALLISILLPALNKARQSANSVKCQSNIRQIMYGFQMYANEYKGMLPNQRVPGWYDWSRAVLASIIGEHNLKGNTPNGGTYDYFRCPMDDIPRSSSSSFVGQVPRSYAINTFGSTASYFNAKYAYPWCPAATTGIPLASTDFAGSGTITFPQPFKLAKVPRRIILVGEEWDQLNIGTSQMFVGQTTFTYLEGHFAGWDTGKQVYKPVHRANGNQQGGNYGYQDGHVEFHVAQDFAINQGGTMIIPTMKGDYNGDPHDPWKWLPGTERGQ